MDAEARAKAIFVEAIQLPHDDRDAFIESRCAGDESLLARVRVLLDSHLSNVEPTLHDGWEIRGPDDEATSDARSRGASPRMPHQIGSYRIERILGEGGMGIVYQARQALTNSEVALKVMSGGRFASAQRLKLFQREAQALGKLRHPHIASIYEADETSDGQQFFAMELVRGVPLNAYVANQELDNEGRLRLVLQICDAVNYAHQRGVLHRDLKPSNILVQRNGVSKVLDFGLARITDPEAGSVTFATEAGQIFGTLQYMAPEQTRGSPDEVDTRCDVYAIGVMLYELVTGRKPYDVSDMGLSDAMRLICEQRPPSPGSIDRSLRGDLETIIQVAMNKDPALRYQTVDALARDIDNFLNEQPIAARAPSLVYQLRKMVRRHRIEFGVVASFLLILFGASVAITVLWIEARRTGVELESRTQDLEAANVALESTNETLEETQEAYRETIERLALEAEDLLESDGASAALMALVSSFDPTIRYMTTSRAEEMDELTIRLMKVEARVRASSMDDAGEFGSVPALASFVRLLERLESASESPDLLLDRAGIRSQYARILGLLGKEEEATEQAELAVAEVRRGLDAGASREEAAQVESLVRTLYGELLESVGRRPEALDQYRQSEKASSRMRDPIEVTRANARASNHVGYLYFNQKAPTPSDLVTAADALRDAMEGYERILAMDVSDENALVQLFVTRSRLGLAVLAQGETDEALRLFRLNLEESRQAMIRDPKNSYFDRRYLASLRNIATWALEVEDTTAVQESLKQLVDLVRKRLDAEDRTVGTVENLLIGLQGLRRVKEGPSDDSFCRDQADHLVRLALRSGDPIFQRVVVEGLVTYTSGLLGAGDVGGVPLADESMLSLIDRVGVASDEGGRRGAGKLSRNLAKAYVDDESRGRRGVRAALDCFERAIRYDPEARIAMHVSLLDEHARFTSSLDAGPSKALATRYESLATGSGAGSESEQEYYRRLSERLRP